jgi:hypothetical protein
MNETPDPLETELSALSPHDISPELRRRIAQRLAAPQRTTQPVRRRLLLAGALAMAYVVAVVFWWGRGSVHSERAAVESPNVPQVTSTLPDSRAASVARPCWEPRLLTYQRALARSTEELEALLNREAAFATESRAQILQFRAFTPSNASLDALLGDD